MTKINDQKNDFANGFTIIEVVIVLAVTGMIFLVVFLAIPQLQASRRDSQRRSDAARLGAAIEQTAVNSQGIYPDDGSGVTSKVDFVVNNLQDPESGSDYTSSGSNPPGVGEFYYSPNGQCGVDGLITDPGTPPAPGTAKNYALSLGLETGGAVCYDSQ